VQPPTAGVLGNITTASTLYAIFGLILTALLIRRGLKGAILLGILITTALGVIVHQLSGQPLSIVPGKLELSGPLVSPPDLRYLGIGLGGLSFLGKGGGALLLAGLLATLSLMLSDFFDTAGTFTALGAEAGLTDERGNLRTNEDRAFLVDSLGAATGGLVGSSSATTYIESGAGIAEGGRTGLTTIVAAIPFFLAMWLANVVAIVPQEATAGALMVVGLLMLAAVGAEIPWREFSLGLPAVFAVMLMPLTWSITNGIGAGIILYAILNARRAGLTLWIAAAIFAVYFALGLK
jgi:AGZA family xanthine/uracil permease-like MFS transporter